jgi:hypothetical protein
MTLQVIVKLMTGKAGGSIHAENRYWHFKYENINKEKKYC